MGFAGVFVVYGCQNLGLRHTGPANGALIHGGIPVFTALLAAPVLGERLGHGRLAGLALSLAGVAAVILPGSGGRVGLSAVGDGLVLLSAQGLAAYLVLGRRAFPGGGALELVAGVAVFGLLFLSRWSRAGPEQAPIASRPAARACAPTRAAGTAGVGGGRT